jgi:hypothetical protein
MYEGIEADQPLDPRSIHRVNHLMRTGGIPLKVDDQGLLRDWQWPVHQAPDACIWLLRLDPQTQALSHFPGGQPMTSAQIEAFNGLEFLKLKLSPDARVMQTGTPFEVRADSELNIATSGSKFEVAPTAAGDGIHYSPSPYRQFQEVLAGLRMSSADVFVDLGCGKGRVVCVAALEPIAGVIGVEHDESLLEIARRNAHALKGRRCQVQLLRADLSLDPIPAGTIYYMFGPFGPQTVKHIADGILRTLATAPRHIRVVWIAPGSEGLGVLSHAEWLRRTSESPVIFENV